MKAKKQPLGWHDWDKIRDPDGMIEIDFDAFDRVEDIYDPQDIQDMFDEDGIEESVMHINREYLIRHDKYALELVDAGKLTILRKVKP